MSWLLKLLKNEQKDKEEEEVEGLFNNPLEDLEEEGAISDAIKGCHFCNTEDVVKDAMEAKSKWRETVRLRKAKRKDKKFQTIQSAMELGELVGDERDLAYMKFLSRKKAQIAQYLKKEYPEQFTNPLISIEVNEQYTNKGGSKR